MRINAAKWNADRIAVETEIKALKVLIRTPGRNTSHKEWQALSMLKLQATLLYKVRAQYRGRQHQHREVKYVHELAPNHPGNNKTVRVWTMGEEAEQAQFMMRDYAQPEEPVFLAVGP